MQALDGAYVRELCVGARWRYRGNGWNTAIADQWQLLRAGVRKSI